MKPLRTYFGSKNAHGAYQNIISLIPRCNVFVDAMVGNGGIAGNLMLPDLTILNDIDRTIIDGFVFNGQPSKTIVLENVDYRKLINKYDKGSDTVFYFDPPYLISTRSSRRRVYRYDWSDQDHVDFLALVKNIQSNVLISHYPCELYDNRLAEWRTHDFTIQSRGGQKRERVYMNFEVPEILQDFRYIGKDYTDRQRIKRKISRHLSRLKRLEGNERVAVLSAIIEEFDCTTERLILKK
ncbi:MAG: DNA adenine methylase [Olivibacter sp.]|nr:DNA adenine methylase [Olivibacter sp. UJ_SKK_5.1]